MKEEERKGWRRLKWGMRGHFGMSKSVILSIYLYYLKLKELSTSVKNQLVYSNLNRCSTQFSHYLGRGGGA